MQDDPFGDDIGGGMNDDLVGCDNDQPVFDTGLGINDDFAFGADMQEYQPIDDMEDNNIPEESDYDLRQLNREGDILR